MIFLKTSIFVLGSFLQDLRLLEPKFLDKELSKHIGKTFSLQCSRKIYLERDEN